MLAEMIWPVPATSYFVATVRLIFPIIPRINISTLACDVNYTQWWWLLASMTFKVDKYTMWLNAIGWWTSQLIWVVNVNHWHFVTWNWYPILGTLVPIELVSIESKQDWNIIQLIESFSSIHSISMCQHTVCMHFAYCLISFSLSNRHRSSRKSNRNSLSISVS